jgi:hypothetical protein
VLRAGEGLDDEHRGTAVSAHEGVLNRAGGVGLAGTGGNLVYRLMQELACGCDVVLTVRICEQAIVSDAVKA